MPLAANACSARNDATGFERKLLPGVIPTAIVLLTVPGLLGAIGVMFFRTVPETNGLAGLFKATLYVMLCVVTMALVAWTLSFAVEKSIGVGKATASPTKRRAAYRILGLR